MEVKDLISTLKKLNDVRSGLRLNFIPLSEMLGISVVDGVLYLTVDNTVMSATSTMSIETEEFNCTVNFGDFHSLCKKLKEGEINLSLKDDELVVKTDSGKYRLPVYYDTDGSMVEIKPVKFTKTAGLFINEDDTKLFKLLLNVCGSPYHVQLNYVIINDRYMYASNNSILLIANVEGYDDVDMIIPKSFEKVLDSDGVIAQDGVDTVLYQDSDVSVRFKGMKGIRFPLEQSKGISDRNNIKLTLNTHELLKALSSVISTHGSEVTVTKTPSMIGFSCGRNDTRADIVDPDTTVDSFSIATEQVEQVVKIIEKLADKDPESQIFFSSHGDFLRFLIKGVEIVIAKS